MVVIILFIVILRLKSPAMESNFSSNLAIGQIIVRGRFWFYFFDSRRQRSISICSLTLSFFLINSCVLISQSSQISFGASPIPSMPKLFRLDLSSHSLNFEDTSFNSKRSSWIPLMHVSRCLIFSLILFISPSNWFWVNSRFV